MSAKHTPVISNFLWRFFERCGAQGVTFVVSVVLARLLDPTVYGTVALITVFTSILQVFVDSGLGNALVQKKDADQLDFSTVFFFNLGTCIVLYILLFIAAPWIAAFYQRPELTPLVRVMGLVLIISGVKGIQLAYVSRHLLFKRFFWATLVGTIGAAIIGIWMAYRGYGVWALVAQHIFNTLIDTIVLWFTVPWRPHLCFSFERLKTLFMYGWKLLVSHLIDRVYSESRQLIIGRMYSSADLAFYNRGRQIPHLVVTNINTSVDSVLFPVMSKEQDSMERVRQMTRRAIKTSTYIMAPMMIGLACVSEPLIHLLLGTKWMDSVFFMRIFCITYMFQPIHTANLNAIKAIGHSDIFLKLEIIKKTIGITVLLISMWYGVEAMAYSLLFTSFTGQIINSWPNRKLLQYPYLEQLKDIVPGIALAVAMGFCVYQVKWFGWPSMPTIFVQVVLGAVIYIAGSIIFKIDSFSYLLGMLQTFTKKLRRRGHQ